MKVKINHKYSYPDDVPGELKEYADRAVTGHRKAWEFPDTGLGKPVEVWVDADHLLCIGYITPDGTNHWYHYKHHSGYDHWQTDGWEFW